MTSPTFIDAVGTAHRPADEPVRIVSLVPSLTELLFDLGLGDQIVGRTTFCVHPRPQVDAVPRVGGTKKVRMDRLRALAPTHVVLNMDENTREAAEEMADFVPHLIVTHPLGPGDNPALYRLLGGIFRRLDAAERLCLGYRGAWAELQRHARDLPVQRVLYLIWRRPWMTVSRATYISRTLALVNWHTLPARATERYPEVALDDDLLARIDLVLLSSEPFPFKRGHIDELRERFAGPSRRIALIDGEMTSWYGSRAIRGLRYLQSFAPALLRQAA